MTSLPPSESRASYEGVVPFHDCDPLGIVWHGNYYKYLEIARTILLKRHSLDVPDFIRLKFGLLVSESRCRHSAPLRYEDRFRVSAWLVDSDMRLRVAYEIENLTTARRAARAWTTLVTTDADGNMLWETPHEIQERLATIK